jgi:hypothetical protein
MKGKCFFVQDINKVIEILNTIKKNYQYDNILTIFKNKCIIWDKKILDINDINFTSFKKYGQKTDEILKNNKNNILIVIGLSDMIRPSNRCDIRFEYMYNFTKYKYKFVIDEVPFKEEKWRIWYPYSVFNPDTLGYPHSYAAETDYQKYIDSQYLEEKDFSDPFPIKQTINKIDKCTEIYYKEYFNFKIKFNIYETNLREKDKYKKIKNKLFEEEKTPHQIIKSLRKYSSSLISNYNLPLKVKKLYKIKSKFNNDNTLFDNSKYIFNMTDLKVDKYLKSEIERVYNNTNKLTGGLYERQ